MPSEKHANDEVNDEVLALHISLTFYTICRLHISVFSLSVNLTQSLSLSPSITISSHCLSFSSAYYKCVKAGILACRNHMSGKRKVYLFFFAFRNTRANGYKSVRV